MPHRIALTLKFSIFFCVFALSFVAASNALILTTASKDGNYYPVGKAISNILKKNGYEGVIVKESHGSIDNIKMLTSRDADLAIIQSDVLHNAFFAEKGTSLFPLKKGVHELRGIVALYPEFVQIAVRTNSHINRVARLYKKNIYVGKNGSGTFQNASDILGIFKIKKGDFTRSLADKGFSQAMNALIGGKIDAVFFTSGELITNKPEYSDKGITLLSLDKEMAIRLTQEKPYYTYKEINGNHNRKINLIFVRAILVGRGSEREIAQGLRNEDAREIARIIYTNQLELEKEVEQNLSFFRGELMVRKIPLSIHSGAEEYFVSEDVLVRTTFLDFAILCLGLIWLFIIVVHWGLNWRWIKRIRESRPFLWLFDQKRVRIAIEFFVNIATSSTIVNTVLFLIFSLMVVIRIILYFEMNYSIEYDTPNPFAELGFLKTLYWLITFAFTGFPQGIFPNSYPAKLAAAIIPIIGVGSVVFLIIYENIKRSNRADKEARGLSVPILNNHVVICGWNERVPSLIWEITSNSFLNDNKKVIVLAEIDSEERPLADFGFKSNKVFYLKGISSDYENLHKVNISKAHAAVIVAGQKKIAHNNMRSVFTATAIKIITKEKTGDRLNIIAEVHYRTNRDHFIHSGATKLVCLQSYSIILMIHACLNPGISDILLNLLSFDPPYNASLLDINSNILKSLKNSIIGKSFKQIMLALRKSDLLLVSVMRSDILTENSPLELEFIDNSPYLVNPTGEEDKITIKEKDKLLIIQSKSVPSFERDIKVGGKRGSFIHKTNASNFIKGKEKILIIGEGDIADNIIKAINPLCEMTVHLVLDDSSESKGEDNIVKIYSEELDITTVKNNFFYFEKITRIMLLSQSTSNNLDQQGIHQDDDTMMLATKLQNIYGEIFGKNSPHIMAELRNIKNMYLFHDVGIAQAIPTNQFVERVLGQMVFHSGRVSEFFLKSMSYSNINNKVRLEKMMVDELQDDIKNNIRGMNYDITLRTLLKYNLQLLAIEKSNGEVFLNPKYNLEKISVEDNDFLYVFKKPDG